MNKTFRELAAYYARSQYETLTHQQKVARLYRRSLRSLTDWKPKRYQWNAVACEIRAEFDSHRAADSADAKRLLREGEERLHKFTHPDPYLLPYMPGGSKFMRNPPPPLEAVFPDGIPPEVNVVSQTIEGVQLPKSAWKDGHEHVLVDPYQKKAL